MRSYVFRRISGPLLVLCALVAYGAACAEDRRIEQREGVLGTSFEMEVTGAGRDAEAAIQAALAEIARLEQLLSTWRDDSELSAYNAGRLPAAALSEDVAQVLALCEHWREASSGAFSCRLGTLVERWRVAEADGQMPDRSQMRRLARELASMDPDEAATDASRPLRFDVDGIAKGYIVDRALARARALAPGAAGIRIDIGGDAMYWGGPEPGRDWEVRIADPARPVDNDAGIAQIHLRSRALAASGHGSRGYRVGRRQLSHVLDPQQGWPVAYAPSAVVVADDTATADALATALATLPVRDGLALVDGIDGAAALIVSDSGIMFSSARWPALLVPRDDVVPALADTQRVTVDYWLPEPTSARYRRPYLAIWIEDPDGAPVRQLHVLGDRTRWLGELPRWWRHYGRNDPAGAQGLARPTRAPGHYTVDWDGRDDLGQAIPAAAYVLQVEAAREHGGYEQIAIPFQLGDQGLDLEQTGQTEVGRVAIRHRGTL